MSTPAVQAGPANAGPPPSVTVIKAARKEVTPSTTMTGRVQAVEKVELRARVSGYLEKKLFEEGADVQQGQLMFVLEKGPYESEVGQINGSLVAARADLVNTKAEFERQQELLRRGVGTPQRVDEARSKYGQAQGEVEKQTAALDQAKLNLSYTDIKAPLSGQVGQISFSTGNYVQQASGTLATIVSHDPIYALFPVTQRELLDLRRRAEARAAGAAGATVRLVLADGKVYEEEGSIDFIDVQFNQTTDSVTVRAKFPNPKRLLIDGQLVTIQLSAAEPVLSIVVPQPALQFDQSGYFVLTVDAENKVKVQPIQIGPAHGNDLEVTGGLKEGDRVIVEGIQKVRPSQVVTAVEQRPTTQQ